ncbi:oncoprotein-induced transcript 3 protein-like [Saccoglossus kowalevskii]|uniref:Oncoprotein-induced transcript 3 protein-like n=1 Tax=Saccoglossus kowalevskii TaxID=10224 RepID=A0ABM0M4Y7_SACKO|nr:PREDICTED: oncoprotein-induced transcript 3 protein-like [Saccoglossus kowalevskii]
MNEPKRSTAYVADQTKNDLLSDHDLYQDWYRFVSAAGGEMTTWSDVPRYIPGTEIPLYLNGTHPSVEDGVVSRTVCGNYVDSLMCHKQYVIQIKNCSSYYVYFLTRPTGLAEAYCAGTELQCQSGYISVNGNFTPGCEDLNECITSYHSCEHTCVNTNGSYYCDCVDGYTLDFNSWWCSPTTTMSTNMTPVFTTSTSSTVESYMSI